MESVYPFLLLVAPFALAFFMEALVIFFFRIKRFWAALGTSVVVNLFSLIVLYLSSFFIGALGYGLDGMRVPLPVLLFFWWLSVVADGFSLQVLTKGIKREKLFLCSIVMNTLAWLFLYVFILTTQ